MTFRNQGGTQKLCSLEWPTR